MSQEGLRTLREPDFKPGRYGRAGRVLLHPVRLAGLVLLILLVGFDVASWRLQRGPVELPGLAARIAAAASRLQPGLDIRVGDAWLAWEGFHSGGAPLDLRLSDIMVRTQQDAVGGVIAKMRVGLSLYKLLHGRLAPVSVIADGATITIRPRPNRSAIQTLGTAAAQLAEALRQAPASRLSARQAPARGKRLTLGQLRLVSIGDAGFRLDDPAAGLRLAAPGGRILLRRAADGAITARARVQIEGDAAAHQPPIPVVIDYDAAAGHGVARAVIGPGSPAGLLPGIKALAALHLPVTLRAALPFTQNRGVSRATVEIGLGRGDVRIAQGRVPVADGSLALTLSPGAATLTGGEIRLGGAPKPPVITLSGAASDARRVQAALTVRVDRVGAAALPGYWPPGLAPKVRRFVLGRVSGGMARDGIFHFGLGRNIATHRIMLDHFDGGFAASGVIFTWLKGLPDMTGLAGTLRFPDKTRFVIHADKGQVAGLSISRGLVVIDGITRKDHTAVISGTLAGPLHGAVAALLAAPRVRRRPGLPAQAKLLEKLEAHAQASLRLRIPLKKHLALRDMRLAARGALTRLSLPLPLGRLALEDGDVRVRASLLDAEISGTGLLAGVPARFSGHMMPGGARRFALRLDTVLDRRMLDEAGFGKSWNPGTMPLALTVQGVPNHAEAVLDADFTARRLKLPALGWSKPAGVPGQARLDLAVSGGRTALRRLAVTAPGLNVAAHRDGPAIAVDAFDIGRSRATGRITPPAAFGAPWLIALAGPVLDLSHAAQAEGAAGLMPGASGHAHKVPWRLRGAFDRLILSGRQHDPVTALNLRAAGAGFDLAALQATALLARSHHVELGVAPAAAGRNIHLATGDAGALLRALGAAGTIDQGRLHLDATAAGGTLKGLAVITGFRLRHAPLIGKVLQGLTLYGLAEATSGPGLGFTRMIAPFTLAHHVLTIRNGRAFSPSLGVTMTGQADFARRDYDLGGTIVPAYALNSLLGRIPVLGRLFRTRKGSGLFSARYTVDGPFAAPHIVVNPLSVLAPGFLAGIFGSGPPKALELGGSDVNVNKHP